VQFLIVMLVLLVVMYVVMIRPQRARQRAQRTQVESAGVGEDILTNGGIYGTITEVDGDDIVVEIAEGVSVHMTRRGIAAVLPPEEEVEEAGDVGEEEQGRELEAGAEHEDDEETLRKRIMREG
jgi:preprotein translocase subunit YajC